MRIQTKTTTLLLILSLVPLTIIGTIAYLNGQEAIKTSLGTSFQKIAHEKIDRINRSLYEVYRSVQAWAKLELMQEVITDDVHGKISTFLMGLSREYGYYSTISVLNRKGVVIASSNPHLIGRDLHQETFTHKTLSGKAYLEDVHFDEIDQLWVITIAFPIKAQFAEDKILGVLSAKWKADTLFDSTQLEEQTGKESKYGDLILMRRDGLIISAPASLKEDIFKVNLIRVGLRSALLASQREEGYLIEIDEHKKPALIGYDYSRDYRDFPNLGWAALTIKDAKTVFAPVERLKGVVFGIGMVVGLFSIIISIIITKRMTKPILRLSQLAGRVARGDFEGNIDFGSKDEIGSLTKTFNQMVQDLKSQRAQLVDKQYLDSIISNMMDTLIVVDPKGLIKTVNKATLDLLGYTEQELIGQPIKIIFAGELPFKLPSTEGLLEGGIIRNTETTYRSKEARTIPVFFSGAVMRDATGKLQGIICVAQDMTERKQAEEALEIVARFPAENPNPVLRISRGGKLIYANPASRRLFNEWGCESDPSVPQNWQHLIAQVHKSQMSKEMELKVGDTTYLFLFVPVPKANYINIYGYDFTDRKRAENALAEEGVHDTLTGLYKRRNFNYRIEEEIVRADRNKHSLAILLCDLDHFKVINDTRGHQAGDEILKVVAESIREATRGTDLVFRWGGDEIMVLLSDTTREGILTAGERIRKGVRAVSERANLDLDLSIGVALYPEHGRNIDELIRLAEWALYIAKKGGGKIHIGEEEYTLDEHSIKVVFQPVVDVRTNAILGYEALSRDPQDKFRILELFKRYQAIGQLNQLKCLCFRSQLKAALKYELQRVFINVDFNLLSQLELVPKPPGMEVILEISEVEALHDVENHLKEARKWRELGYKFALDDFGAGFISLPFIAELIPDYIKVDRSTILQAVASEEFRRFLSDLVLALQNYSKQGIIAEGIETEKELKVVKDIGIYIVQGYLLGKPQELK